MNLLFIEGSSTAFGSGSTTGGWAHEVHRAYPQHDFQNRAFVGASLGAINRRWDATYGPLPDHTLSGGVRILSTGQNEARINPDTKRPIISLQLYAGQLLAFSEVSQRLGLVTVYVGPQPVNEALTNPIAETGWFIENDMVDEYAEVIKQQAVRDGSAYVDVVSLFQKYPEHSLLDADGRHPNNAGHRHIARAVVAELTALSIEPLYVPSASA